MKNKTLQRRKSYGPDPGFMLKFMAWMYFGAAVIVTVFSALILKILWDMRNMRFPQ